MELTRKCVESIEPLDAINPSHYKQGEFETIEVIDDLLKNAGFTAQEGYYIGNIIKYLSRCKNKNGIEDMKKAQWYLNRLVQQQEGE